MHDQVFDELVSGFYRAATGELDWSQALAGVQQAFGARTAILQSADLQTGQILGLSNGGPPMNEAMLEYVRKYHHIDPRRQHLIARGPVGIGQWWHCHEHFDEQFVERDRFYQEFLPAYETRYLATLTIMPSEHVLTAFALELPASRGVLTPDERESARRLGVHMQDALRAYQRVRLLTSQALAGHGLLRSFAYPMWLIDGERYVHFSNEAADREAAAEARVARRGSHLVLPRSRADALLTERLYQMQTAPHGSTSVISLQGSAADAPVWLHLSLLVPEAVFGAFGTRPLVLVTLFDPQLAGMLDPFALGNLLKLTPAQSKVAVRLADGLTAEQIAAAIGCSVATVRTHIRQIIERLGVQRITDVIRLLRQGEALWSGAAASHGQ